ncbi:MAG: hypothetical protein IPF42_16950 [Candidatus Microthrix sp.]|nr:hypothetical protein [Candidatus Microthrix sp.]
MAVTEHLGTPVIADLFEVLERANVDADMANPGTPIDVEVLQDQLGDVIEQVRNELQVLPDLYEAELAGDARRPQERLRAWEVRSEQLAMDLVEHRRAQRVRGIDGVRSDTTRLIESMHTQGDPLIRVLAVMVGPSYR